MGNSFEVGRFGPEGVRNAGANDFTRIAAAGFKTIRLPVRWSDKTADDLGHAIDPKWMAQVDTAVGQALDAGLNVILNDHHFEALDDDPAANSAKLAAIWRQVAKHFADRPTDRLWFEIENEPHKNLTNANLLATLNPSLAAIRESNPDRPVIIGGENWSGIDSLATLELPDDDNVYPTFHYYEPFDFTHQGATWAGDPPPKVGRVYGNAADAERLVRDVDKIRAYVERTGKVPFMGETGAYEGYIEPEQRAAYHRAVREAFAPTGIGVCAWAYTNTFPFYDQKAGRWIPGMLEAFGLPEK
ncbi:cellulase family glycosylhydrolase [Altererythrobacter salegens]|uniref:Cellulase family glycosylhydrolase n=2 Tax=Croceibacterium salegens TaxID=1737568 RepID=A0A6I4SXT7_9SPHN|nr:cellulase family glycosylhydrolase [Croceibacterium salegens]